MSGVLNAGGTDNVTPNAFGGISSTDVAVDVVANQLSATAGGAIDLDTTVVTITGSTTGAGGVNFDESDGVTVSSFTVADGGFFLGATAGTATLTLITLTTDSDLNDVGVTAGSTLTVDRIVTGGTASDVALQPLSDGIVDASDVTSPGIIADDLTLTSGHCVYRTEYHIVWIPKYRRRILNPGVKAYVLKLFPKVLEMMPGCGILEQNVRKDHLHLVMVIPPKYAVSDVVGG